MTHFKIRKNSLQETLIIPLYARWLCSQKFPGLFQDKTAGELIKKVDYDFSSLEKQSESIMYSFGALEVAMRQNDLAWEIRDYLHHHPKAAVINLGCGLDNTGKLCDNGQCHIWNIDLPDVIELRDQLLPAGEREKNLAFDLTNPNWMKALRFEPENGAVIFAAGVFYYFTTQQVQQVVTDMAKSFPGGRLVFDAAGKTAVKLMLKTWIKQAGIRDIGAYFSVKNAKKEMECWSPLLSVSTCGYMQGYQKLEGPGIKPIHRFLAKIADGPLHLQIVQVEFKENIV